MPEDFTEEQLTKVPSPEDVFTREELEVVPSPEDILGVKKKAVSEDGISPLEDGVSERPPSIVSPTLRPEEFALEAPSIQKLPTKTISEIPLDDPENLNKKEDFKFWDFMGRRFTSGSEKLLASIFRSPETIYDVAVNSFNLLLEGQDYLTGLVGIEAKARKLATTKQLGEMLNIENVPAKRLETYAAFRDDIDKKYQKPITESIASGNYKDAAIAVAGSISESLPFTLAILVPAAAGVRAAPLVAGVTTTMGAQRKQELIEREDLTETQKNVNSLIYGLAESIDVLFGAGTVGRAIKGVVKKEGVKKAKKWGVEMVDNLIRNNPYLQPFVESLQEGTTTYIQNLSDITVLGEKKQVMEGVSDAMIVGGVMGLGGGGVVQGVKTINKITEKDVLKEPPVELEKEDFEIIEKAATDTEYYEKLTGEFTQMTEEGTLTEEEGTQLKETLDNTIEFINKIPPEFEAEKKNKAYLLIKEKQQLELENEKLDDAFKAKNEERITVIDDELKTLQPEVVVKEKIPVEAVEEPKPEVKPEKVKIAPEIRKYTSPTEERYGYIQEEGKERRELTKEEFEAEQAKVVEPVKEEIPPTKKEVAKKAPPTEEETRIKNTNRLLDLKQQFNTQTSAQREKDTETRQGIVKLASELGYKVSGTDKIDILTDGKSLGRPREVLPEFAPLTERSEKTQTFVKDVIELGSVSPESLIGIGLSKLEIEQAIRNIEEGKDTKTARDFIDTMDTFAEQGFAELRIGKGVDAQTFRIELDEFTGKKEPVDIAKINEELLSLTKKEEIPDETLKQFESRTGTESQELEQRATDIESKGKDAETNRDTEAAAEILRETDEFIKVEREKPPIKKPPKPPTGEKIIKPTPEEENAKEFVKEFDKQTKEKIQRWTKNLITKVFKKNLLTEKFFDDKAFAKRQLEKAGATEAIWKKNLTLGSGAESKARVEEMTEETFGTPFKNRLTPEEKSNLNKIILFRRTIELDNYKDGLKKELESLLNELKEKGLTTTKEGKKKITTRIKEIEKRGTERLKHTVLKIKGKDVALTKELAETWLSSLKTESPEQFKKLTERADKYFKNNKELLKDRLDEGLIDQETFDRLVVFDYSKRIFVERMMDFELLQEGGGYSDSEIKSLKEGSEDLLFDNAEALLRQNISSTTRLVFENRANQALGRFFEKNETDFGKNQESIGTDKKTGQPKYPQAPIGWKEIKYKEEGKIKSILVTTDFYKSWASKDPIIKQSAARALQWGTGTKPIKFFATGVNPFFAFYNFVRDPGHVYFFTDNYSVFLPKAAMQLGKDLFTVSKDAWTKKGRTREYTKEGGAMDFLTTQGVAKSALPKTRIGAATNLAIGIASKLNHTSEMIVRLAVRERQIKDLTNAFIKKNERNPTPEEIKEIKAEATSKSRAVMDFSQKGEWVRAADNFLPYLAASFQGLNVAARAFRQRPLETSARIAQGVGLVIAGTLYNLQWGDEDEKNGVLGYDHIPDYIKSIGLAIMMPYTTTNNRGDKVRPYIIIPIPHEFSIFKTTSESVTEWAATGDFKGKPITKSLKIAIPVRDPRDVPIMDFLYAYELGYDRFRDKHIWKDAKIEAEAEFTLRTPEIYKDIGKATGLSPDRMKLAAGKLFTQHESNIYSIAFATGYESVKNLLETEEEKKQFNDMAAKAIEDAITPLQRRFYRYPTKRGKEKDIIEEKIIAENTRRKLEEKDKIYDFISEYRRASEPKRKEIEITVKKFAIEMEEKSVGARNRIMSTFNKGKKTTTIKSRFIVDLLYTQASPEAKAVAIFEVWKDLGETGKQDLIKDVKNAELDTKRWRDAWLKLKSKK